LKNKSYLYEWCIVCFNYPFTDDEILFIVLDTLYLLNLPRVLTPLRSGGIEYLNDPESYADWSFHTPVRATKARQVEG